MEPGLRSLESCLVAIVGPDGNPAGSGVLIDDTHVLTCAHVVNMALGRDENQRGRPDGALGLKVRFHGAPGFNPVAAEIDSDSEAWRDSPVGPQGDQDQCLLCIKDTLPQGCGAAHLVALRRPDGNAFRAGGYPENWANSDVATGEIVFVDNRGLFILRPSLLTAVLAAEQKPSRFTGSQGDRPAGLIHGGFSGGPVLVGDDVVAIVVRDRTQYRDITAYAIPATGFLPFARKLVHDQLDPLGEHYPHIRSLRADLSQFLSERQINIAAPFDVRLRFCKDYPAVLDAHRMSAAGNVHPASAAAVGDLPPGKFAATLADETPPAESAPRNRVILLAPGGSGKSSFLGRLLLTATDHKLIPFLVDLSQPRGAGVDESKMSPNDLLTHWLSNYFSLGPEKALRELGNAGSAREQALLVIDGLNQTARDWSGVLTKIWDLSRTILPSARIVVADRMINRKGNNNFRLAVVPPLSFEARTEILRDQKLGSVLNNTAWDVILGSPLFLNILLKLSGGAGGAIHGAVPTRFSVLDDYFRCCCGLSKDEMRIAAGVAFDLYNRLRRTSIPLDEFHRSLGEHAGPENSGLYQKLVDQELLTVMLSGEVQFRHQLLHDFLAALQVASTLEEEDEKYLRAPAFDALSLDSASPDAVELAAEALRGPRDRLLAARRKPLGPEEFIKEVYDWNYWITLQCVTSFDRRGENTIPPEMKAAVYALNLEKRFDTFLHTAARAERGRQQIGYSTSQTSLAGVDIANRKQLLQRLRDEVDWSNVGVAGKEWFELYAREKPFSRDDLGLVRRDPLTSWTAANVLLLLGPDETVSREMLLHYRISRETSDSAPRAAAFRWRLVHALGRAPYPVAAMGLFKIMLDCAESYHVRYGAVRSLIETTIRAPNATAWDETFNVLLPALDGFFNEPLARSRTVEMLRELRRLCAVNEPALAGTPGWLSNWLSSGLPWFVKLLRRGMELAGVNDAWAQKDAWEKWLAAAEMADCRNSRRRVGETAGCLECRHRFRSLTAAEKTS